MGPDPQAQIVSVTVTPPAISVIAGADVQLQVFGTTQGGDSVAITPNWTADGGTLGSDGTFASNAAGTFHVVARAEAYPFPADTAVITVSPAPRTLVAIDVQPFAPILSSGEIRPFQATGTFSDSSQGPVVVTWSSTGGTISQAGLYTAGAITGAFQVIASSGTVADTVPLTISAQAPTVSKVFLTPDSVRVDPGASQTFGAFAQYTDGTVAPVNATFSVSAGTISAAGVYVASQVAGVFKVIAVHQPTGLADTSIVVVNPSAVSSITLSPNTAALNVGATQQFSVVARLSNGTTSPVIVNFSATGGSIGGNGLYAAGPTVGTYQVVATTLDRLHADTSIVTLNKPGATLSKVLLSPDSVSLLPGGTQQFTSAGLLSDGTVAAIAVRYTATGGTITPGGLYTAPQVAGLYKVIATSTTTGIADTSRIGVNQPVSLTGISLTPASVQLLAGGIQQFTAVGKLSNGGTTTVNVNWSTTDPGGTLSSTGQYRGGPNPGTFLVIAQQTGGLFADTSSVTLTNLPPPGNNACNNQPSGLTVLFDQPFDTIPPASPNVDSHGWFQPVATGRVTIAQDTAAPKSKSKIAAGLFPSGSPGGSGPFKLVRKFNKNVTTFYMCIFTKLDPGFTNNGNAGTKFGFFLTPYAGAPGAPNNYLNLTNNLGINIQLGGGSLNRNMFSSFSLIGRRGTWNKVEVEVKGNSLGNADGIARMWVNDSKVLDVTNVQYFISSEAPAFNGLTWNPTYGGGLNPVPYDMWQFIDDWYVATD